MLVVLGVLLWRTAAQQVKFQGRHLFAVAGAATLLWLLVLPRVRWRPASGGLYAAAGGVLPGVERVLHVRVAATG